MKIMRQVYRRLYLALLTLLLGMSITAVSAGEINTGYFGNVAIEGYDPVAYFTENRPMKGSEQYSLEWLGAIWHFANERHRELFAENPIKYAPQYGGHCADGTAFGDKTANIDPEAWRIIDGKLYLNHDQGAAAELEDIPERLKEADANWPKIRAELIAAE